LLLQGTHTCNRYNVANTEPRPESYYEDYTQVNNASYYARDGRVFPTRNTTQAEKDLQYRNLASGAESGWDFSARFMRDPTIAADDTYFPLASYNIISIVPVELNAILYWNEVTIAGFLRQQEQQQAPNATTEADAWDARAASRSEAMHAVMWNDTLGGYSDFNLTSGSQDVFWARDADSLPSEQAPDGQQVVFNVGQLSPFWTGAAPRSVAGDPAAVRRVFSRVDEYLSSRKGGIAPTNFVSGQQWDQPSVWPPHMHILMEALLRTAGEAVGGGDGAGAGAGGEDWAWASDLALRLGQRYFDSAYCTW
jgi:alpha,alpha-trehalase